MVGSLYFRAALKAPKRRRVDITIAFNEVESLQLVRFHEFEKSGIGVRGGRGL